MALLAKFKGPLSDISQVINIVNILTDAINALFVSGDGLELSGVYFIPSGEIVTVAVHKQMINKGGLDMEGDLVIEGQFFAEA